MSGARLLAGLGCALLALAIALGGPGALGRTALALGLPEAALALLADPYWRGVALHRAGAHDAAAQAFAAAGARYAEGVAAAHAGAYARSLAAFDAVLHADPADRAAAENRELVAGLFAGTGFDDFLRLPERDREGPTVEAEEARGTGRAQSTGSEATNAQTGFQMPEIVGQGLRRTRKIFDAQFLKASDRWLDGMPDEPGLYLGARLALEQKRREEAGTALPPPEDPR